MEINKLTAYCLLFLLVVSYVSYIIYVFENKKISSSEAMNLAKNILDSQKDINDKNYSEICS